MLDGIPLGGLLDGAGTVVLIVLAAIGYIKGWWVSGREFRAMVVDRDFWRHVGIKGVTTAEKMADQKGAGVASLESIVKTVEPTQGGGDP